MNKRIIPIAALALGYVGWRGRRANRARVAATDANSTPVSARGARALVEAVLGSRPDRRPLAIDFAPAIATGWELLIDGPAFFPRMLADIDAARSDVHILIFGFRPGEDRHPVPGRPRCQGPRGCRRSGSYVDGVYTPAERSGHGTSTGRSLRVALRSSPTRARSWTSTGRIGHRRIDWRFDDFGHFDHRKVVVVDGRVGLRRRARDRGPLRRRAVSRRDAPPGGPDRRPAPGGVPAVVALPGRIACRRPPMAWIGSSPCRPAVMASRWSSS